MRFGYRLCKQKYAPANGDGAKRSGGRWNHKGFPALYLADSIALAVLEVTVHALELPTEYLLWRFRIPDHLIERIVELRLHWSAEESGCSEKHRDGVVSRQTPGSSRRTIGCCAHGVELRPESGPSGFW